MVNKEFMSLCPRSKEYTGYNVDGIPVTVIQDNNAIDYTPDISFTGSKLENGWNYFHNNTGKADKFSISILINENDTVKGKLETDNGKEIWSFPFGIYVFDLGKTVTYKEFSVITALDYFIRNGEPFYITTDAVGINTSDLWLVTDQKKRKQKYDDGYVEWDLTFTKYNDITLTTYQNNNAKVMEALGKNTTKDTAKTKKTSNWYLKNECKRSQLKYSNTKKSVKCVEYMQRIINKKVGTNLTIDGWYGKETREAVKKFQNKFKTKFKLNVTGNVDVKTYDALIKA